MTSDNTADVVIVGAGIGGLTTALALHAQGIHATVLEAADEIRPLGVGLNIQPAAIAELTALGLGDELAAAGIATREHRYLDHTGKTLWAEPRGLAAGHEFPQYSIHRGALQMLLLTAVRGRLGADAVRTGARVHTFEHSRDGVLARIGDGTAQTTVAAGALIGADGLHSAVRARLHPDRAVFRPTRVRMWRGLTELGEFLDGRTMILANDERGSRLVAYPISPSHAREGRTLLNWVCLVSDPMPVKPGDIGWNRPAGVEEILPHYARWDFGWLSVPDVLTRSGQILHFPMADRDPLPSWGEGRVTLLGDAAHPMYPIGANGATQAIVDAAQLATELARHHDVPAALRSYEDVRRPATTAIIYANRAMDSAERAIVKQTDAEKTATLAEVTSTYRATVERPRPPQTGVR